MQILEVPTFRTNISQQAAPTKAYTIATNKKAFQILADGIYKHKIKAIIRELSANATDAHIAAGHNEQFIAYLPTKANPIFAIEDFGTGLSPQKIDEVYTEFFASDKSNSNAYIGAYGLGSKSPFCYNSRSFIIETWYEGTHYVYTNCVNEYGIPECVLLTSEPTTRRNGTKISLPVDANDIYEFKSEAEQLYQYFNVQPKIVGQDINLTPVKAKYEGKGWKYVSKGYIGKTIVVMGGIPYPVEDKYGLNAYSLIFSCKIGEVDTDTSREGVSYTKKTLEFLDKMKKQVKADIKVIVENKIKDSKNAWQAKKALHELMNDFDLYNQSFQYDNKPITIENIYLPESLKAQNYRINYSKMKKQTRQYIYSSDIIVVDDLPSTGISRIRQYLESTRKHVTLIHATPDRVKKLLGCDDEDFILTSSLPYEKPTRSYINKTKLCEFMMFNTQTRTQTSTWLAVTTQPTSGVYVVRDGYKLSFNNTVDDFRTLKQTIKKVEQIGVAIPVIYGVRQRDVKNLDGNWESIEEFIERETAKVKDSKYKINLQYHSNYLSAQNLPYASYLIYKDLGLPKEHPIGQLVANYNQMSLMKHDTSVLEYFGYNNVAPEIDIGKAYKDILSKYPMLKLLKSIPKDDLAIVKEYILNVDKENEND
jgi:Histidine kinase-, DNA gyrase B-, and HSP90-like ATPase